MTAKAGKSAKSGKGDKAGKAKAEKTAKPEKLDRKVYEEELRKLQVELCNLQEWVKANGKRVIIILEGRDTAGKSGLIRVIKERVSPRVFRVVALGSPTASSSVRPSTRSTPARLYQLRSKITTSPATGNCSM